MVPVKHADKQSAMKTPKNDCSHCQKSVLFILLVVSGLALFIFFSLMVKWHIVSQSVIVEAEFDDDRTYQDGGSMCKVYTICTDSSNIYLCLFFCFFLLKPINIDQRGCYCCSVG